MEAHWTSDPRPPTAPERAAQFLLDRFMEVVTLEGGYELEDRCVGEELEPLAQPDDEALVMSQGCGGQTRFELPYEKEDGTIGFLRACAACDLAIRWPRLTPDLSA